MSPKQDLGTYHSSVSTLLFILSKHKLSRELALSLGLPSSNVSSHIILQGLFSLYFRQGRKIKAWRFPMSRKTQPGQEQLPGYTEEDHNPSIGLYDPSNALALQLLPVHLKSLRERNGRSATLIPMVRRRMEKSLGRMRIASPSQIEMSIDFLSSRSKTKGFCFTSASLFR